MIELKNQATIVHRIERPLKWRHICRHLKLKLDCAPSAIFAVKKQ
jgi:hypothetical protein